MIHNSRALYDAFVSKDARLDGEFFVGISSTGIYCRPICRARQPKFENCSFYTTAAEAELNGYRPCLLCRPELSPGHSIMESSSNIALSAARLLEKNCSNDLSIQDIADRIGCTDRHLRRVFLDHYNVTPIQYLQTCRLLLAKQLLTETTLSITNVAMSSGFGSLRRFNNLFKEKYNLTPTALRKNTSNSIDPSITLLLSYRPPYLWKEHLEFLETRLITGIELVRDGKYMRTIRHANSDGREFTGVIIVDHIPHKNALSLTLSESLLPILPHVISRVQNIFDLTCEPYTIYESLKSQNDILSHKCKLGVRVPGCFDPFEMSVRAILGQQITIKAARTLTNRFINLLGTPINTDIDGLTHTFPTAHEIVLLQSSFVNDLGKLGVIATRSRAIIDLAHAIEDNLLHFDTYSSIPHEIDTLKSIKGIGNWTAHYIAMRAMGFSDAFLETDVAVLKALSPATPKQLQTMSEAWRPWRSYAVINLWNTLQ